MPGSSADNIIREWAQSRRQLELVKDWRGIMRHPDDMVAVNDGCITGLALKRSCVQDYNGRYHHKSSCLLINCGDYDGHYALKGETVTLTYGYRWTNRVCHRNEAVAFLDGYCHRSVLAQLQAEYDALLDEAYAMNERS